MRVREALGRSHRATESETPRGSDANTGVSNNGYIHYLMRVYLDISITGPSAVCLYPLLQPSALAHIHY